MRIIRLGFRVLSAVSPGLASRAAQRIWFTPPRPLLRPEARAFLDTGARFDITVNGRPVAAWRWGSGRPVVLMHGWGGYAGQFHAFVPALTAAGMQAIAFDAPAHGASGPSRLGRRQSTLLDFADVLMALRSMLPEMAGVIAHSGGAMAAAWALDLDPTLRIDRLVLISPMGSILKYQRVFQRMIGMSDAALRRFQDDTERLFGFRWADLELPALASRVQTPPTLVIHDRDDSDTPWEDGQSIAAAWPQAELHTTTGNGHYRILRDPDVVGRAVQFVAG